MRLSASFQYFLWGATSASLCFIVPKLLTQNSRKTERSTVKGRKVAIVFGDSITQKGFEAELSGWVALLSNWWSRRVDVLNAGFSGYNSRNGLKIFEDVVVRNKPQFLTIFFGANDAVVGDHAQHVPLDEYRNNIDAMVRIIKTSLPLCTIILITPPPIWEDKLRIFNIEKGETNPNWLINRTNERAKMYADAVLEIALKWNVGAVDLWRGLDGFSPDRADYLLDGLHLSNKGNLRLFELLTQEIHSSFAGWLPANLQMDYPHWSELPPEMKNI